MEPIGRERWNLPATLHSSSSNLWRGDTARCSNA
nr:MAG TPA: hypothetical protein [Caudoviricetes sp.]